MGESLKTCATCAKVLVRFAFHASKASADGLQRSCKKCQRKAQATRKEKIRERRVEDRKREREALLAKRTGPTKCELICAERERLSALRFGRRAQ